MIISHCFCLLSLSQECYLALERHQNVHLPQVARLVEAGGPWASLVLQAILSESILPQNEGRQSIFSIYVISRFDYIVEEIG